MRDVTRWMETDGRFRNPTLGEPAAAHTPAGNETDMFKGTQYTRVAVVTLKPGTADQAIRRAENTLLPLYRSEPGFVAYTVAKTGDNSLISFSIWQQREQAEKATQIGETWVKEHAGDLVESMHNHIGKLGFFQTSADLVSYSTDGPATRLDAAHDPVAGYVAK